VTSGRYIGSAPWARLLNRPTDVEPSRGGSHGQEPCEIRELRTIRDPRGNLTFVEGEADLPYSIRRAYFLYDIPGGASRGGHAHRALRQCLIALHGSFDVVLDDGSHRHRIHLNRAHQGLVIPPMWWRELENFSSGSVCLVLASHLFDEGDYIRDFSDFQREVRRARPVS
jgi:hypothetical protein